MKSTEGRQPAHGTGSGWLVVLVRVALSVAALWALRRELHDVHADALMAQLRVFGWSHVTLALLCTAGSFLILGVVELLALRNSAGSGRVGVGAALGTGFVANALSQSVGIALLTGAAVRARAYRRHGLDAVAIAQVTAFVTLTATIGLLAAGAVALLVVSTPLVIGTTEIAVRPMGALLACIVLAYIAWSVSGKQESVGLGRWRLMRPSPTTAATQTLLSVVDWLLAAMVLWAFMPNQPGLTVGVVISAYIIAQTVAVTSHVPAGAGVFEVAVLGLMTRAVPGVNRSAVVAALVMFRIVYYAAPLILAIVWAGIAELMRSRRSSQGNVPYADMRAQRAS